jgi:hypothetical protein
MLASSVALSLSFKLLGRLGGRSKTKVHRCSARIDIGVRSVPESQLLGSAGLYV